MMFEPRLLSELSEKRDKEEKIMKNIKPLETVREVKQIVLLVGGGWISGFAGERRKSDIYDS